MEFISRAVTLTTFYKSPKFVNVFEKHPNRMTAAHFRKTVFSSSSSSITRSRGHAALPRLAVLELGVCGGHFVQLQQRVALLHTKVLIKVFQI